nr:hypothetical protein [Pyramidobacter porci]
MKHRRPVRVLQLPQRVVMSRTRQLEARTPSTGCQRASSGGMASPRRARRKLWISLPRSSAVPFSGRFRRTVSPRRLAPYGRPCATTSGRERPHNSTASPMSCFTRSSRICKTAARRLYSQRDCKATKRSISASGVAVGQEMRRVPSGRTVRYMFFCLWRRISSGTPRISRRSSLSLSAIRFTSLSVSVYHVLPV